MTLKTWPREGQSSRLKRIVSSLCQRASEGLLKPVDTAGLAFFRIAFYGIMLWEVWRFLDHGWVRRFYTGKEIYFTYWPFDFFQPLPGDGMMNLFYAMAVVAVFAAAGLFYKMSATAFLMMFTYVFLLEKARYLNHLYLACLIAFLMIFVPAHKHFSLDALLNRDIRSKVVPAWSIWLLRFQVGIPMFFGGIAKINADWLRGEPLRSWLESRTDFPVIGHLFTSEGVIWLINYWSIFLDLLAVFLLLNRRTRVFAFIAILHFHFTNSRLFDIGIFPWMMILATAVFFEPGWPSNVLNELRRGHSYRNLALIGGFCLGFLIGALLPETASPVQALIGGIGVAIAAYHIDEPFRRTKDKKVGPEQLEEEIEGQKTSSSSRLTLAPRWTFALIGIWAVFQVLIPLRHFAISGNVHWTEEGQKFSWHMMLNDKDSLGSFVVTDTSTGEEWKVDPEDHLTSSQVRRVTSRPDMTVQFAHHLANQFRMEGREKVEVRAFIISSLNGREHQLLIDPYVDLASVPSVWFGHADWIVPQETPLRASKATLGRGEDNR